MRSSRAATSTAAPTRRPPNALALELVGHLGVIGDHDHHVAELGTTGCVLGIAATTDDGIKAIVERARNAGATVATEPAPQPWGYAASFVDPDGHIWTVTSAKRPD